jgi:hypothetical protein
MAEIAAYKPKPQPPAQPVKLTYNPDGVSPEVKKPSVSVSYDEGEAAMYREQENRRYR